MTDIMQDNRKVEVAARINVQSDRIQSVQLQLNVLRNQGILVDLSVSGTGMFTRTATWAEIGIQVDRVYWQLTSLLSLAKIITSVRFLFAEAGL